MNRKKILSTITLLSGIVLSVSGNAQNVQDSIVSNPLDTIASYDIFDKLSEPAGGRVILGGDDVKSIIGEIKTQKNKPLKGYRIRIFRDSKQAASRKAESIKGDIEKTYPGLPVYVRHDSPTFYVEVGDYRTQEDAEKMRRTLISAFPETRLVSVSINFPTL
ncbi:MAG: SPOR domain-containing protein [Prevotellaceae bacterium]|jgi:hypothetical protein|nr:SPOR domain-containing protein [Prevotellaceae bacterium]